MPITAANKSRYPKDWKEIRARILARAKNCCEWCGVANYAVGRRDKKGNFQPLAGNGPCDAAGEGRKWPSLEPITYPQACEFAAVNDLDGEEKLIVIVLTVAHVKDSDPANVADDNLAALCQRCHNRHDMPMRRRNAAETLDRKKGPMLPFGGFDSDRSDQG